MAPRRKPFGKIRHARPRGHRAAAIRRVAEAVVWNLFLASANSPDEDERGFPGSFAHSPTLHRLLDRELGPAKPPLRKAQLAGPDLRRFHWDTERLEQRCQKLLARRGDKPVPLPLPAEPLKSNLLVVQEAIGASDLEVRVLLFALATLEEPVLGHAMRNELRFGDARGLSSVVAAGLGLDAVEVLPLFSPRSALSRSGMIGPAEGYEPALGIVPIDSRLVDALYEPGLTTQSFVARFIELASEPTLGLEDFPGLGRELDGVVELLKGAMAKRETGINVLFWGGTGVGKTECAKLVARAAGAQLYVAGISDASGQTPTARDRLSSGVLGNKMLNPETSMLLFDEMDDITGGRMMALMGGSRPSAYREHEGDSKAFLNLHLEENRVATVWTVNDIHALDPAFRRRFAKVVCFPPLDVAQRRNVLRRHLSPTSRVTEAELDDVASRFPLSAAHLAKAVKAAQVAGTEDAATLHANLEQHFFAERGYLPLPAQRSGDFLLEAVNSPVDLAHVAWQLESWQPGSGPGVSLCLYGAPGTGKTQLVHWLAARMKRRVVLKRVSDIQNAYVGRTERNIADAFQEATREGAFLLFDEADSFLRDRRTARHSWEVTFVNEFLSQLEAHRGLCACTTNLFKDLDEASLRRFTFKIPFLEPIPRQSALLFRQYFAKILADAASLRDADLEAALSSLQGLTAGDFAAVGKRLATLHQCQVGLGELLAELRSEVAVKQSAPRKVGFASFEPRQAVADRPG
ncbi:MAG: ATP-binding protein [Myxococcales bacterium]